MPVAIIRSYANRKVILGEFPSRNPDANQKNAELLILSWTCAAVMYLVAILIKNRRLMKQPWHSSGTLVGFLGSIYIPIGALSESIGNIMKCTPIIYGSAMFKSVFTQEMINISQCNGNRSYCIQ